MTVSTAAEGHTVLPFDEAVLARRSVRAFRKDPVPRALIEHIFSLANHAPSNCNTQPWYTVVASGAVLDLNGQSIGTEAITINGEGISSNGALINSVSGNIVATINAVDLLNSKITGGITNQGVISGSLTGLKANNSTVTGNFSNSGLV